MVWLRRQQVREEVTGKLVPVEIELKEVDGMRKWTDDVTDRSNKTVAECGLGERQLAAWRTSVHEVISDLRQ